MMMTANNFTFVTLTIFTLSKIWHQNLDPNLVQLSLMIIMWLITHIILLYVVLHMAHFTKKEVVYEWMSDILKRINHIFLQALKTASLIHKIANKDKVGIYASKILTLSLQLQHRVPVFSCGLFSFDLTLGFKVIWFSWFVSF